MDQETRETLERWLAFYNSQQSCYYCEIIPHQCRVHPKRVTELDGVAAKTQELLAR